MASRILAVIMALGAIAACGPAMSAPQNRMICRVVGAEKLPADSGGSRAVCAAVERAIATRTPGVPYTAEIRVLSPSGLAATLVTAGRSLPELQFSVSDRNLNPASIERFAEGLADHLEKATK